jgi:hypothetical protein
MTWLTLSYVVGDFLSRIEDVILDETTWSTLSHVMVITLHFICNIVHHIFEVGGLDFIFRQIQKQLFQFSVFQQYLEQLVAAPFDLATTTLGECSFFSLFMFLIRFSIQ